MIRKPTGRLDCSAAIPELVYERELSATREEAWAALTGSDLTAQWIGSWSGDARKGGTVNVVWLAEEGTPTEAVRILACDPPRRLALAAGPDFSAPWLVTIEVRDAEGGAVLEFRQQMSNGLSPALVGAGWEFYLDRYETALAGEQPSIPFEEYSVLQPHYEELQAAMALCESE